MTIPPRTPHFLKRPVLGVCSVSLFALVVNFCGAYHRSATRAGVHFPRGRLAFVTENNQGYPWQYAFGDVRWWFAEETFSSGRVTYFPLWPLALAFGTIALALSWTNMMTICRRAHAVWRLTRRLPEHRPPVASRLVISLCLAAALTTAGLWAGSSLLSQRWCRTAAVAPDLALDRWLGRFLSRHDLVAQGTVAGWLTRVDLGGGDRAYLHIVEGRFRIAHFAAGRLGATPGVAAATPAPNGAEDGRMFLGMRFGHDSPPPFYGVESRPFSCGAGGLSTATAIQELRIVWATANASETSLEVPLWAPLLLFMLAPAIAFFRGPVRRFRRWKHGCCPHCAYDLTGNVTGRCSECGVAISPQPSRGASKTCL